MTPAVSMRAESPGRRCFGREPGEVVLVAVEAQQFGMMMMMWLLMVNTGY